MVKEPTEFQQRRLQRRLEDLEVETSTVFDPSDRAGHLCQHFGICATCSSSSTLAIHLRLSPAPRCRGVADSGELYDETSYRLGAAEGVAMALSISPRFVCREEERYINSTSHDAHTHTDQHDEEAALEALRAAISGSADNEAVVEASPSTHAAESAAAVEAAAAALAGPTLVSAGQVQSQSLEKAVAQMQQLSAANLQLIDSMNAPAMLQGLLGSFKLLADSNRRQAELVKNVIDSIQGRGPPTIDPQLAISYVPRSEYDSLKARYDALFTTNSIATAVGGPGTARRARMTPKNPPTLGHPDGDEDRTRDTSGTPFGDDEKRARKRRSMKLEHLVHKMANRRLGVEYTVSSFEVKGSKELPMPGTIAPEADTSLNGVDEFRPDFRADVGGAAVRPFLDAVTADVKDAWGEGYAVDEPEVDNDQIVKAVTTYWTRLSKRYDEQLSRERGEVHKDELTRRKQNQYRRQQSLVARRAAAFDTSPLNLCKFRALYRTLLTIDFAAMTNERPDPKREYTTDEWYAYRKKSGPRGTDAHEVVDQFWLSAQVRALLVALDAYAYDQNSKVRRKGRPKQPAPTFHLPPELWDRSLLPVLRKKQADGMPQPTGNGIVLFKFHVDEKVLEQYPDWAAGLYDTPPVPDEDRLLPSLSDVMNANAFYHLKPRIKQLRSESVVLHMTPEEVQATLADPSLEETQAAVAAATLEDDFTALAPGYDWSTGRGLESVIAMAAGFQPIQQPILPLNLDLPGTQHGPSPGSSVRARKQAKRMMSEVPGGAATPVPKRQKTEGVGEVEGEAEVEVDIELNGDTSFLDAL
ncbi:hypothetical protein CcaverHIS631_0102680 [Cutaneotrichosporon cavernicola]|nr:hypothetical protein CcaverHIS631_0102680 [Cutaneotrichosporon cavernicola]